ncbi:MAG TPA: DEAD/DEAH box helicase family protein [Candidatus Competibacteraceae bacterium]|nr:DEAD/DEAH box helicase family protein [Candidatus Competibacteraceae bacterium]HSA46995.1 DEAD/DEAH box helicase family protein [Candidatus Competibacteraceae bacterium]
MSAPAPKRYQSEAVNNVLDIFRHAENQMQAAADEDSRRAASAFNGCVLLEAPTGAGKTLMAGLIAEAFARPDHRHNARIIWFWFTPFANLVEQAKSVLKRDFPGLRVRDLASERVAYSAQSGDVFVTTWASVAARNADTRKLRTSGDLSLALDEFIPGLRQADFRIGVVVDEAHHGFTSATEAVRFCRDVMRPDFTLLITATPDDADVEKFRKAAGIGELHRHRVSRKDAVDAGLIKEGVQCIAYLAPNNQETLGDIPATALAEGWKTHNAIKAQLAAMGINLTPLMLVQVGNKGNAGTSAIQEAKTRLLELGVSEDVIAWYTADEPNDDLLAVALDESKEVLLFKMAVALGFDAPRAFTVVSMRGAKDTDFGVQVVGRILRVHRRLQSRVLDQSLPEALRCGYVFLAEAESQSGLIGAGEKINAIQTELSGISPYTLLVRVAGETQVQVTVNGQTTLLPQSYTPPTWKPVEGGEAESTATLVRDPSTLGVTQTFPDFIPPLPGAPLGQNRSQSRQPATPSPGNVFYPLRVGAPTRFHTERLPLSTDELVQGIGAHLKLNAEVLNAGLRQSVKITRKTITDIFGDHEERVDTVQAKLSHVKLAVRAQSVLYDAQYYNPRDLEEMLLSRLRLEYNDHQGIGLSDEELRRALNLILAIYPRLLRDAARICAAHNKEIVEAAPLPESMEIAPGAQRSRLNVYGVMPPDLNEHERKFAEWLDADPSGTVLWWHRNEPRKPWSIGIVLPDGDRYFPDFAVGVNGRARGAGALLVETKGGHLLNSDETLEKSVATHKTYGPPVMIKRRDDGSFWIVRYIESRNRVEEDQAFRVENMAQY